MENSSNIILFKNIIYPQKVNSIYYYCFFSLTFLLTMPSICCCKLFLSIFSTTATPSSVRIKIWSSTFSSGDILHQRSTALKIEIFVFPIIDYLYLKIVGRLQSVLSYVLLSVYQTLFRYPPLQVETTVQLRFFSHHFYKIK